MHRRRKRCLNAFDPINGLRERHAADRVERDAANAGRPGSVREPIAAARRADGFLEKLFHPFHAFFVFDLGERIFNRVDSIKVGEIKFARTVGVLGFVEDPFFDGRPVKNDVALLGTEILERHIRAHAHRAADVDHERPHQGVPRRDGAFFNCEVFIGNERRFVNCSDQTRAAAFRTGPAAVKGQIFCARRKEMHAAGRANDFLLSGDIERRRHVVSVWTAVACQAREDEAQAVEEFCSRSKSTADPGNSRPLVHGERRRHIKHFVNDGLCGLRHAAPGVG